MKNQSKTSLQSTVQMDLQNLMSEKKDQFQTEIRRKKNQQFFMKKRQQILEKFNLNNTNKYDLIELMKNLNLFCDQHKQQLISNNINGHFAQLKQNLEVIKFNQQWYEPGLFDDLSYTQKNEILCKFYHNLCFLFEKQLEMDLLNELFNNLTYIANKDFITFIIQEKIIDILFQFFQSEKYFLTSLFGIGNLIIDFRKDISINRDQIEFLIKQLQKIERNEENMNLIFWFLQLLFFLQLNSFDQFYLQAITKFLDDIILSQDKKFQKDCINLIFSISSQAPYMNQYIINMKSSCQFFQLCLTNKDLQETCFKLIANLIINDTKDNSIINYIINPKNNLQLDAILLQYYKKIHETKNFYKNQVISVISEFLQRDSQQLDFILYNQQLFNLFLNILRAENFDSKLKLIRSIQQFVQTINQSQLEFLIKKQSFFSILLDFFNMQDTDVLSLVIDSIQYLIYKYDQIYQNPYQYNEIIHLFGLENLNTINQNLLTYPDEKIQEQVRSFQDFLDKY